ncbi:dihydrofolate reductase [Cylindrospermum sp. FACHB-282]|uniref:dihydrofolate reductase n=1 Tax=Cylindrospermum sp. FACHB-282 TaxID=2692794 RepID=UPI001F559FA6|nr:dihydrofolate reductase [Cylindrospermum sp. FACHB-282]
MNQPEIILIAALAASNRVMGKDGKLPWSIPADSQRFVNLIIGHAVIMGRKTWEYDLEKRPIHQCFNVVVSASTPEDEIAELQLQYSSNLLFVTSISEALQKVSHHPQAFIVGGASIYSQTLTLAHTWELTLVDGDFEGDTFFPEYEFLIGNQFEMVNLEPQPGFRYETYKRIL